MPAVEKKPHYRPGRPSDRARLVAELKRKWKVWSKRQNYNQNTFSSQIGVHPTELNAVLNGKKRPSVNVILAIVRGTGGYITCRDLLAPHI